MVFNSDKSSKISIFQTMDRLERCSYWKASAEHDLPVIADLFNSERYDWALFIGHLVLEKILKARWVFDNNDEPPKTHNLSLLAKRTQLKLAEDLSLWLLQVNDFNLETRYPDYKMAFHKRLTKDFTSIQIKKIKETYLWIAKSMS